MLVSVSSVTALLAWCIIKVLKSSTDAESRKELDLESQDVASED
ncbi:MAG: Uncharacterised protein [Opitutia bacterium UBA7350]|nr:MAG: Uncharacterised protein [Opitutae bacterium UBA7350]